jgi:hypothetical protein
MRLKSILRDLVAIFRPHDVTEPLSALRESFIKSGLTQLATQLW